jgi:hypothetical protein
MSARLFQDRISVPAEARLQLRLQVDNCCHGTQFGVGNDECLMMPWALHPRGHDRFPFQRVFKGVAMSRNNAQA